MAKTLTQRELLSKVSQSTISHNYDLTLIDAREYAAPLDVLFQSADWKDIFIRRTKLFRAAMGGDRQAFKQLDQIDRKVGIMLLDAMFKFADARLQQNEGKVITLNDYFEDFIRTEEQHALYEEFSLNLDSVMVLADILDNMLNDAQSTLKKLDPSVILSEFRSIKSACEALRDFTHIHHRDENDDLNYLFSDNAEECEEYLRMKTALFVKNYQQKRQELIANGSLDKKPSKKHSDREYCIDLLSNYFFIEGKAKNRPDANRLAQSSLSQFSDEEITTILPTVIELYHCAETIHQAKDHRNMHIKTLPPSPFTQKILNAFL